MQTGIMHIAADVSKQDMNRMANIGMKRQLRIAPAVATLDEHKLGNTFSTNMLIDRYM